MLDYISALRRESARFGGLLRRDDLGAGVPSCPEWNFADLGWHLAEVQYFWATIAGNLLADPGEVTELARPEEDAALPALFDEQSAALLAAVTERAPEDACWSWDANGGTVAWVRRRQAHEALIHRIDAELAAGADHAPIDPALAADGVDEILDVMMSGVPEWGTFTPEGTTVRFATTDTGDRWDAMLGRLTGTSPNTGNTYDLDAMDLLDTAPESIGTTIAGTAADLDLWLWGRGDEANLTVDGDASIPARIRAMATETTR